MSSSEGRRAALLGLLAAVGGCTLRPLYGPQPGGAAPGRERLALQPLPGREGYIFREALARRFVLDPGAPLVLTVNLSLRQIGLAISRQGDVSRVNIEGTARFALVDRDGGAPPIEGSVRSISGTSTLASAYATRVAREAAEERVLTDLAERVFAQIAVRRSASA